MNKYNIKRGLFLTSIGLLCWLPDMSMANDTGSSTTSIASITFADIDAQEVYPYNPEGEGYLEFTKDPGGVQSIGSKDLKLMWVTNFAFSPEDPVYDYLDSSTGIPKDVQAYVKQSTEDASSDQLITLKPLIQIWNSDKTSWDLKVKATPFFAQNNGERTEEGIPMLIQMNELVRGDSFINDNTLPKEADKDIYNVIQANNDDGITVTGESRKILSFNNEQQLSGFSTYFFQSKNSEEQLPLALWIPEHQKIEKNKVYHADVTWTLSQKLEP